MREPKIFINQVWSELLELRVGFEALPTFFYKHKSSLASM